MDIIFENDDVVVINKPAGVLVHGDGVSEEKTVVDWFLKHCPDAQGVGEESLDRKGNPIERSGVMHRLDKDTSGLLVLAKHTEAHAHIKKQFHDRVAKKEYRTFVYGTMKEQWGTIDRPIGRSAKDFRLRSAQRGAKGTLREAVTDWERIGQSYSHAYLKVFPRTGRTHQIRVHLKAIGRPVVQDPLYATEHERSGDNLGMKRLALHAHALDIILPDGTDKHFIAPLPLDFIEAADSFEE